MKVGIDGLPEELELKVSQTSDHTVVAVDAGGSRLGKLYINKIGIVISPGNANKQSGTPVAWKELVNRAQQD